MTKALEDVDCELFEGLLQGRPFIDVRAPIEFKYGAVPGAVNLPLLNDDERAAVGTAYKKQSPDAAVMLGLSLVSGENRERKVAAWIEFAKRHPSAWLYCHRGGLRSQSVARALKDEGIDLPVVKGGYKRIRYALLQTLLRMGADQAPPFAVVTGLTGSGKTLFLKKLASRASVCDLEALACHRGSAFGRLPGNQPSQTDFENKLAVELLRLERRGIGPFVFEDESRAIGQVHVPNALFVRLSEAPLYLLEKPVAERAHNLVSIYLSENYGMVDGAADPQQLETLEQDLLRSFDAIGRSLGGRDLKDFKESVFSALREQARTGRIDAHHEWVEKLLVRYYDPLYQRHLDRNSHRIVRRGSEEEILEALLEASR